MDEIGEPVDIDRLGSRSVRGDDCSGAWKNDMAAASIEMRSKNEVGARRSEKRR